VPTAGVEIDRVVEGVIAALILAIPVGIALAQLRRSLGARRRAATAPAPVPALARFTDTEITDAPMFGGGAWSARVRRRRDTVTYGYLAVVEEYTSPDSGAKWCTLTVTFPGSVPFLVVDHRTAIGRPGVPLEAPQQAELDDPPFDATYLVGAADPEQAGRVLSPAVRDVLLRAPVQRLMLHESRLLLRTFDGVLLDDEVITALDGVAARFLAATPSFVTVARAPAHSTGRPSGADDPLPEGFYGPTA
jgi:hypothetical protein